MNPTPQSEPGQRAADSISTPRTDYHYGGRSVRPQRRDLEFAQKLERENAELLAALREIAERPGKWDGCDDRFPETADSRLARAAITKAGGAKP